MLLFAVLMSASLALPAVKDYWAQNPGYQVWDALGGKQDGVITQGVD